MISPKAIPCFTWIHQAVPTQAVLVCIHGLTLHGGTYVKLGKNMCRQGIVTYAPDIRGFGRWNTDQLCVLNFDRCLSDIKQQIHEINERLPGVPVFLLGESLGAAVAISFAAKSPELVDGLVLCSPARTCTDFKWEILRTVLKVLTNPGRRVSISESVSRYSPTLVSMQEKDPAIRFEFTVSEIIHLCFFLFDSFANAPLITQTPVLVMQGDGDRLITCRNTLELFERIPAPDKELVVIGGANHLIMQTADANTKALSLLRDWILSHCSSRQTSVRRAS
jgi:acylglycerol lipase